MSHSSSRPALDETLAGDRVVTSSIPSPRPSLERGTSLGRYVAMSELGRGGMGTVWAAYDPELDRRVAIKLLHRETASHADGQRLLREARALAKLSHPNVVAVYDVGTFDERIWIAMEHIDGATLKAWLGQAPRAWQAVLDVAVPVGRGLAAAHAQGLVHRDIKPDNIMLGDDGRPRVMDFGLARPTNGPPEPIDEGTKGIISDITLTPTGAVLGTPAYMAPEQFEGRPTDARTDVFSFCVTLWEAVHGQRPFAGTTMGELYLALTKAEIRQPPRERSSPAWLRQALVKGLAVRPEARWPSMEPLLVALAEGRVRRRRRRLAVAGVGALAVIGGTLGSLEWRHHAALEGCEREGQAEIHALWPGRAAEVEHALAASPLPYAAASLPRLRLQLDEVAAEWSEQRAWWCRAVSVEHTAEAELGRRAVACLHERRAALQALMDLWSDGDEPAIRKAVELVTRQGRLQECSDEDRLRRGTWPSDGWDEVAELRRRGAHVDASATAGRYVDALASAREIHGQAQTLGFEPLVLEAELRVGSLLEHTGDYAAAETNVKSVYFGAGAAGHDTVAAKAAIALVFLLGNRLARFDEALQWAEHARMELERQGGADVVQQAVLANAIAGVREARGEHELAGAPLREALALAEPELGPEHPSTVAMISNLAGMAARGGRLDEAEQGFARVLELRERLLGPEHPDYADALANLASVSLLRKDYAAATPKLESALRAREAALGSEHPKVAELCHNLGIAELRQDHLERARMYLERAVLIRERELGPDHPELAASEEVLAHLLRDEGDSPSAIPHYRRVLEIRERAFGPDHPFVGNAAYNLANALVDVGEPAAARVQIERALALAEREAEMETRREAPAWPLQTLAFLVDDQGEHELALAHLQRAVKLLEAARAPGDVEVVKAHQNLQRLADRRRARGEGEAATAP